MNTYIDSDGTYWVGSEEHGVVPVILDEFHIGHPYDSVVWNLSDASDKWELKSVDA